MMKRLFFLALIAFTSLNAHRPAINYAVIDQWRKTTNKLTQNELQILHTYLQDVETFAQSSINNPQYSTTEQGKALQKKIDSDVTSIMKNHNLIPVFEQFTMLIKKEVGQEKFSLLAQRKKEYVILALVVKGCLACVERRLI